MLTKFMATSAFVGLVTASASFAQQLGPFDGPYVVGEIGYENGEGNFDQFNYGAAIGYNFKLGPRYYLGGEFDIAGSTSSIVDYSWAAHGQFGYTWNDQGSVFARAGYRELDFDFGGLGSPNDGGISLGVGTQRQITDNLSLRAIVDTLEFDTIGVRTGAVIHF